MKTSVPSSRLALALASSLLLGVASASAQLVQSWQFNEVAGTSLAAAANSGPGSASFATGITGVATNGAGSLVIASNAAGASARAFADIADITTGVYQLDVNIAGWNYTGSPALGPLLEIGFAATTNNANSSRLAHLFFEANDAGTVLAGVAAGIGATSTADANDQLFSLVQGTSVTFRLVVDFNAATYTVSNSSTGYAATASGLISNPGSRPATHLQIRALDDFTIGATGGSFAIDSITLTAIPEPSTYAALAGLAILGVAVARRRR